MSNKIHGYAVDPGLKDQEEPIGLRFGDSGNPNENEEEFDEPEEDEEFAEPNDIKPELEPEKPKRIRVSRVNLEHCHKYLLNALWREVKAIYRAAHKAKLSEEDSKNLVNYLKLVKDLRKGVTTDEMEKLSDKELEKLVEEKAPK